MRMKTEIVQLQQPGGPRPDNENLAEAARDAIQCLTTIPLERIQVTAQDGRVELHGRLDWRHQRNTVEDVIQHLPGVRGVANLIEVIPPPGVME